MVNIKKKPNQTTGCRAAKDRQQQGLTSNAEGLQNDEATSENWGFFFFFLVKIHT